MWPSINLKELPNLENLPKSAKLSALYQDDFEMPIFMPILQSGIDLSDILHVNHGKSGFGKSKREMEPLSDQFDIRFNPTKSYIMN